MPYKYMYRLIFQGTIDLLGLAALTLDDQVFGTSIDQQGSTRDTHLCRSR